MLIGQTLFGSAAGVNCYGPWFFRQADQATFVLELLLLSGGGCTVTVQHKMREETDASAATLVTFATANAMGVFTKSTSAGSGMKELVRYKYLVKGGAASVWMHLRMNEPVWQPN
jgi:hypothetical protein